MRLLIKNGRVIDPANDLDGLKDLLVEQGKIKAVGKAGKFSADAADRVIDAQDCIVAPGFIDVHVHFREPGFEYKETIQSGCESAAAGGFTTVAVMPNTDPVNDNRSVAELILSAARTKGVVNVLPIGAISKGMRGEELSDMGELRDAGVIAFSDDGLPVMDSELMRRAFEYSRMLGLPLVQHSEMLDLTRGGCMNEGLIATELGLKGMPSEAEDIMVSRDIALLERTGGRLHVAHISSGKAVDLVRSAKAQGLPVTCEAAPHHFTLTDESVRGYDTNTKMSPPLRNQSDVDAIKNGLRDGAIDIIATDHAPHDIAGKAVEYSRACFGIVGLETALPLTLRLVAEQVITLPRLVEAMAYKPATIFNLDKGTLTPGKTADIVIFDPNAQYTIDAARFKSRSKNTPFNGWQVTGKIMHTLVGGAPVYTNQD